MGTEEPAPEIKADLKEIKQDKKQKRQQKSKRKSESERKSECEKDTLDSAVPEEEIVPTVEEKLELLQLEADLVELENTTEDISDVKAEKVKLPKQEKKQKQKKKKKKNPPKKKKKKKKKK